MKANTPTGAQADWVSVPKDAFEKCEAALKRYTQAPTDYHKAVLILRDSVRDLIDATHAQPAKPDHWNSLLAAVMREMPHRRAASGNAPGHAHNIPGVWDSDNGALAGTECAWCLAWNTAQRALVADISPQPPESMVSREFLERALAAMEGVIDVADRKTVEFDALRSCVVDLTLMLFKPEALPPASGHAPG